MGIERTIKASSTGEEVEFFGSLQSLSALPVVVELLSYHPQKGCPFLTYG